MADVCAIKLAIDEVAIVFRIVLHKARQSEICIYCDVKERTAYVLIVSCNRCMEMSKLVKD